MKILRYAVLAVVLVAAVLVAFANRAPVTLALWPDWLGVVAGVSPVLTLPLFVVIGTAVGLGLVLGLVWEWLRERGYRKEAAALRREVERLRAQAPGAVPAPARPRPADEVVAILDERPAP
jgi:hypothetical protein